LKLRYMVVETGCGWVAVAGSPDGLNFSTLPVPSRSEVLGGIDDRLCGAVEDPASFGDLAERLQKYFGGARVAFPDKIDSAGATEFQRLVWDVARSIPYGEVRSYSWLAERVGRTGACRAAGNAMARNRFPIIVPCHRVVAKDGSLGGFGGGLGLKRQLLEMESRGKTI
jgi:methylated-DNA-[protein]-cysteine S-methyltransferase